MKNPGTMQMPAVQDDVVPLGGGLDQVTPTLTLGPGRARRMVNFECAINGGYTRIGGYERFNGKISPSSATFQLLPIPTFLSTPSASGTLTGNTSGTTASLIAVGANHVAVTLVSGTGFIEGEIVSRSGVGIGAIGAHTVSLSKTLTKQYVNRAADVYRALIDTVPGTGPVRGVFGATFGGIFNVYALRDKGNFQNQCYLYKATSTGWVIVHGFPNPDNDRAEINFINGGPVAIPDDVSPSQIPQVVARRVVLTGGSWAANTATGKIIYTTTGGSLQSNTSYTFGNTSITTTGVIAGSTLFSAGGRYEFDFGNFYGQLDQSRVYGCDGRNRAWEFDGKIVVPIDGVSGITGPPPTHIKIHKNHLFASVGSSVLHSGVGEPFNWTAIAGAGEMATGDTVTGFQVLPGVQASGSMAILSRNQTKILYGTALAGPEPFDLVSFETETGALPFTIQKLDKAYYLDDRGVVDLQAVQAYGNFATATLTRFIQPFINQKTGRSACSSVHRGKGQYRLFFNDGTGLYITLDNGKLRGVATIAFPVPLFCAWAGEDSAGQELSFVGGTDGFVYQLDRGTSLDGANIDAELLLNWNTMKSPRVRKTVKRASIEFQDTDYTEIQVAARLGPGLTDHLQDGLASVTTPHELDLQWDHFTWDDFYWDSHSEEPLEIDVKGTAERVQYAIKSSSAYLDPFTLTSIITSYIPRRRLR